MFSEHVVETDVLVIGGGIAACFAAIRAKEQGVDVTLVDKGYAGKSGETPFACCFMVFNEEWGHKFDDYMWQVNTLGDYINNMEWTEIHIRECYDRFKDLESWGVQYVKQPDGTPFVIHAKVGSFPSSMNAVFLGPRWHAQVYRKQVVKSGVNVMDRIMIAELLKQDGKIVGAIGFSFENYDLYIFKAKATVMATGASTFKPDGTPLSGLTGDGDVMAYRAGASVTGKEWNDPHTARGDFPAWPWSPRIDFSKVMEVMKEDPDGEVIMARKYNALGELIAGDLSTGPITISDMSHEAHAGRAPIFWGFGGASLPYRRLVAGPEGYPREQIDLEAEKQGRVRMVLGGSLGMAHHKAEGIWPINTTCATELSGLYAAGDSLGARQCGAAYCAMGYALSGSAVTGHRAGLGAAEYALQTKNKPVVDDQEISRAKAFVTGPAKRKGGFTPGWVIQVLRNTMMPYWVLFVKKADRLESVLQQIEFMRDHIVPGLTAKDPHELRLAHETRNMVSVAEMKLRASLFRKESRGTHYREDYPRRDDPTWLAWVKIREENGKMNCERVPVPKEDWPDLQKPYEERYSHLRFPGE